MSYWSISERNLFNSGIGRFCRLEFQRMANWPSFDQEIETEDYTKQAACFVQLTLCFAKKIETGPVSHSLELRACEIGHAIRPTIIVPKNKTRFFSTLAGFFFRGR